MCPHPTFGEASKGKVIDNASFLSRFDSDTRKRFAQNANQAQKNKQARINCNLNKETKPLSVVASLNQRIREENHRKQHESFFSDFKAFLANYLNLKTPSQKH